VDVSEALEYLAKALIYHNYNTNKQNSGMFSENKNQEPKTMHRIQAALTWLSQIKLLLTANPPHHPSINTAYTMHHAPYMPLLKHINQDVSRISKSVIYPPQN
jgi:hypothetical protein